MRIGLVTTSFPRHPGDIAGNFVLGFARALAGRGHRVEVLAPEPDAGAPPPRWPDVSVRWVPYLRPRRLQQTFYGDGVPDNLSRNPLAWMGLGPFTVSLCAEARRAGKRWDARVSHWALPCALAAGRGCPGRPHLAVLHSADVHLLRRLPGRRRLAERIARNATRLLFVSPGLRDDFIGLLPPERRPGAVGCSRVFPMGIEPAAGSDETREALRRRLGLKRFALLSMGRLIPLKGIDTAIRALSGRGDAELLVAGDGPERGALRRLACQCGARVRFAGTVAGKEKADLFRAADAFVCASRVLASGRTEGMPTALLEALSHGLPVIATDVGGIKGVVRDGESALLVPPSRPAAAGAAIDRLMKDARLRGRLRENGRAVAGRYTWPALAPKIEALLG
jgi:glycosyltransferase involved in cell wall biosynthesis